jgi:hypothetical protein
MSFEPIDIWYCVNWLDEEGSSSSSTEVIAILARHQQCDGIKGFFKREKII